VPVTSFRSTAESVRPADVRALAQGSGRSPHLVLVDDDADAILAALNTDRRTLGDRLKTVASADALAARLEKHRTDLGFLRAEQVGPSVRAIDWGTKSMFGVDRVGSLGAWPLTARLAADPNAPAYDPKQAWTMVAGGDILLDRGVSLSIGRNGTDFPFAGGTAAITGRCANCSPFGWDTPYTKRTGNAGAVRDLIHGADIAIANFENPAPNGWSFHDHGTIFSANPKNIAALKSAGIDWVSMANNHIGDAGRTGILQTARNLDAYGIAHAGAGRNTAAAHKAALIDAGGVTVGLLGYDTIAPSYWSGPSTPGSAHMTVGALKRDIAAARAAGADVVVVMPHWGVEYHDQPTALQQKLGRAAIDAGADMVIGNHPHWVGAMEVYKGKPIWYALGNLVFDQTWSIPTMEGITVELTFDGTRLVQSRIRPHLILDKAQPNFMDPAGSGRQVLNQLYRASGSRLPY
jgi:poly-gamma-glutamate synthesis protein (capsule biosynthesis protein)